MNDKPDPRQSQWLQVVEGRTPILLIAPHGGRAGPSAHARLHPRINDLHTADITRELARRLGAHAMINSGMDRNALDCNRVEELARQAPWLLTMLAARVQELVSCHGRALVLVIHGWNVIEPRIDFGLGARVLRGELRPVAAAHITAGESFINGPLANLCERLQAAGIYPTMGLRYPAGGRQNLLQIFTARFGQSPLEPLRSLANLAEGRVIDALQLELSVALRWPGPLRERTLGLLAAGFAPHAAAPPASSRQFMIAASGSAPDRARAQSKPTVARPPALPFGQRQGRVEPAPLRFGVELYDPAANVGIMASMDLSKGGGARVIMLLGGQRVAICTAEGKLELRPDRIVRGPIALELDRAGNVAVCFRGPALVVPDASAYLRMERALAIGSVDHGVEIRFALAVQTASGPLSFDTEFLAQTSTQAAFGEAAGALTVDGATRPLDGIGRVGLSLMAQPEQPFTSRCSLWSYFPASSRLRALEARLTHEPGGGQRENGRVLIDNSALDCRVERLHSETWSPGGAPARIEAMLGMAAGVVRVTAIPNCFMALSRPGPDSCRIYTALGFASFALDGYRGAGMFECSKSTVA